MNWKTFMIGIFTMLVFFLPDSALGQKRIHSVFFEGTDYELHVYRIYGKVPGKTLLLIGGIQGDEPGGFLSADHYADTSLAKGNLIVVPRANFQSIVLNRRKINEDMNRKFAEDRESNYEAKIVAILKKLIAESDCLLNLHDGSGYFSEKWESPERNPLLFGQSIIADSEYHTDPKTGQIVNLGAMARLVTDQINKNINDPAHYFHFNNHRTGENSSLHKEQRKSATYYALHTYGIPAFGIETSKTLPLEMKVRYHNLAINAFMERLDIVPETPGINLEAPELRYLVISINDTLPVVVENRQTLHVNSGDTVTISHIEANYERGLSADIIGYGTISDVRKKVRITSPAKVVVRKDYYPCGSIDIAISEGRAKMTQGISVSGGPAPSPSLQFFKTKVNGQERTYLNHDRVKLVRGDTFEVVDVVMGRGNPSEVTVNFKGYVGDRKNNTGEDRGYVINTGKDLWKRYSLDKNGKTYQVVVTYGENPVGKLFLDLNDPALN